MLLVRRQVLSLDWLRVPLRFWWMGADRPGAGGSPSSLTSSGRASAPSIDAGRLAMVGLVRHTGWNPLRLTQSHQVLAYAYEVEGDAVTLRLYDPNWPGRDDVSVTLDRDGARQSTGEALASLLRLA